MSSESDSFRQTTTQSHQAKDLLSHSGEFISSFDGILSSTPRKGRSVSYLDVTHLHEAEGFSPYTTSWERMRGLSKSISDLKILREKQIGRRSRGILFEDNFLQEHAQKLEEARRKIKALERKYRSSKRPRSNSNSSVTERNQGISGLSTQGINTNEKFEQIGPDESSIVEDSLLPTKYVRRSLIKELGDDRSDTDGGTSTDIPNMLDLKKTRIKNRRPVTWADDGDLYSSDCKSVSSYDLSWRKRIEMIADEGDIDERLRFRGYRGSPNRPNSEDNNSGSDIGLQSEIQPGKTVSPIPNTQNKAKWCSMPNLLTNQNECNENRQMMYGEAIPVDPNDNYTKHNTKFGRRSGLYVVNENPEEKHLQPLSTSQKLKLGRKLFYKNGSSKKLSSKYITISSPKEAQSMGRLVSFHPTVEAAYIVELKRPVSGTLGFLIQKGFRQHKNGIFICRITDKKAEKFFGGLIHIGDEILEINNTNVQERNLVFVDKLMKDLMKNSDKFFLTILPSLIKKNR